jgi:hypothetical protein
MSYQDPDGPRGSRSRPDIDPDSLPPGTNPPRYRHDDRERVGSRVVILSLVVALAVSAGIMLWATSGGQQTATNPPEQTTGQSK